MSIRRVVPDLATDHVEASLAFYTEVLGFQVAMDMPIGAARIVTLVSPSNPTVQLSLISRPSSTGPLEEPAISIEVADVNAAHARAVAAGVRIVYPLTTEPWGVRRFFAADPDGVVINVMSHAT